MITAGRADASIFSRNIASFKTTHFLIATNEQSQIFCLGKAIMNTNGET